MGHEDLGKHLESIGDLNGAAEAYSKMRPDISTTKQIIDVGKHLVRVSLQRREWGMVSAHLSKMGNVHGADGEKNLQPYLKIVQGLSYLGQEKYKEAALSFLQADASVPGATYNEVASPNDVAVYGGLLALASMDRKDLQAKVLDNSTFRTFLELEPHIRRAVTQFVNGRYSACIATLEAYRADYLLDIYLQKHITKIYSEIRSKCIVQYMIPFSCVKLDTMAASFGGPDRSIEDELASMIRAGTLKARINTIDRVCQDLNIDVPHRVLADIFKLVTAVIPHPRLALQTSALETAQNYEKEAIERLRRMSLAAADLELKGKKITGPPLGGGSDLMLEDPNLIMT